MAGAAVLFGLLGGVIRHLSPRVSTETLVFFRNAVGLLAVLPFLIPTGRRGLATRNLGGHIHRALAGLGAMYLSFYALGRMPLADAMVLGYTAPLFMPFIARRRLGEKMPAHGVPLLALGFLGVVLIFKPGLGIFQPAAAAALASGLLAAVAQVGIRELTLTEPSARIVFYFGLVATAISAAPLAVTWQAPSPGLWPWLALIGVQATAAQLFLTAGYRRTTPSRGGPLMYLAVAAAGVLDWVVWGRRPGPLSLAGIGLIVLAGALILRLSGRSLAAAPSP